jgi:DNA invertase Pin-like site-specific DNA recombinase
VRIAGYVRVSSREQGATGLGLQAQKEALSAAAAHRDGWQLATVAVEVASAGNLRRRPVLTSLLDDMDAGRYDLLVVSRLDRLARSVGDFATTLDRAKRNGWELVCLDPAVDMTTPYGKAMAGVAAVFAELERELISQRTKEGLAVAVRSGRVRRRNLAQEYGDRAVIDRIVRLHQPPHSYTLGEIMRTLEAEGVPTRREGGRWTAAQVRRILIREAARSGGSIQYVPGPAIGARGIDRREGNTR